MDNGDKNIAPTTSFDWSIRKIENRKSAHYKQVASLQRFSEISGETSRLEGRSALQGKTAKAQSAMSIKNKKSGETVVPGLHEPHLNNRYQVSNACTTLSTSVAVRF